MIMIMIMMAVVPLNTYLTVNSSSMAKTGTAPGWRPRPKGGKGSRDTPVWCAPQGCGAARLFVSKSVRLAWATQTEDQGVTWMSPSRMMKLYSSSWLDSQDVILLRAGKGGGGGRAAQSQQSEKHCPLSFYPSLPRF